MMELRTGIWNLLGFGILPLWLAAGGADWACHRRTSIERTSGPRESLLHLVLFLEIALPVLLALWLEINTLMLLIMAAAVLAHMATSWWDTSFAQPRRHIAPFEQQVHSWLEMLPLFALLLVALLHYQYLAEPHWQFARRDEPVPDAWRWAILLGFGCGFAFILEEWSRGMRASRPGATEPPAP
jgi:hypothetical protein